MKEKKTIPTAVKEMKGTLRKHREPVAEPVPSGDKPRPPHWLNDRAKEVFEELVLILDEMQLASASQVDMLTLLSQRMEEVERFSVYLDEVGTSYETVKKDGAEDAFGVDWFVPDVATLPLDSQSFGSFPMV